MRQTSAAAGYANSSSIQRSKTDLDAEQEAACIFEFIRQQIRAAIAAQHNRRRRSRPDVRFWVAAQVID